MDNGATTRIGVLGGTFNPVHMGHLVLAQDAFELFELTKVLFIPCARPPHKSGNELVSADHRLAMLEAAVEDDLRFEVSDLEIRRGGVSYSVDTARELKTLNPGAEILFIIGSDSLRELHLWKEIGRLLDMCRFVTLTRPGPNGPAFSERDIQLEPPWPRRLLDRVRSGHSLNVSSSDIRYRVAEGMSIRYLVPPAVEMYIAEHSLYRK